MKRLPLFLLLFACACAERTFKGPNPSTGTSPMVRTTRSTFATRSTFSTRPEANIPAIPAARPDPIAALPLLPEAKDSFARRGTVDKIDFEQGELTFNRLADAARSHHLLAKDTVVVIDGVTKALADLKVGHKADLFCRDQGVFASKLLVYVQDTYPPLSQVQDTIKGTPAKK
jgi:hypothetical protein